MKICPACSREYGDEHTHCRDDGVALVHLDTGSNERVQDLIGHIVDGRYRIERIVGRGGMGTVYACRHVVVGRAFAMKVLRPGIERSEEILQRFIREAQAANAVQSRHICEMTDFGQLSSGAFYVVMELLHGMSLTRALREKRLMRKQIKHVFIQVAETLDKAHRAGIIHRDLKPDNVVLVHDEGDPYFVKLVDFGIAKLIHTKASSLTETGVILGTPYYMSPEQARGDPVDHRSDIYAVGVMMYRAFTGKLPFVADTAMGVLTRHLMEKPTLPSRIAEMDTLLEQLILRCLEKRPIDRFQSMADLADGLRSVPDEVTPRFNHPTLDERSAPLRAARHPAPLDGSGPEGPEHVTDSTPTPTKVATPRARAERSGEVEPSLPPPLPMPPGAPYLPAHASGPHPMISSDAHSVPPGMVPMASPVPGTFVHHSSGSHSVGPLAVSLQPGDPRFPLHDPLLGEAPTNRGLVSSRFTPMQPRYGSNRAAVIIAAGAMIACVGAAGAFLVLLTPSGAPAESATAPAVSEPPPPEPAEDPKSDEEPTSAREDKSAKVEDEPAPKASGSARAEKKSTRPGPRPAPAPSASDAPISRPPPEIRSPFEND